VLHQEIPLSVIKTRMIVRMIAPMVGGRTDLTQRAATNCAQLQ
jgi:hypothetical protein